MDEGVKATIALGIMTAIIIPTVIVGYNLIEKLFKKKKLK